MTKRCVLCNEEFNTPGIQCESCRSIPEALAENRSRERKAREAKRLRAINDRLHREEVKNS